MDIRLSKNRCHALTLIEMMISTGLAGLLATVAMTLMYHAAHSFAGMANYVDMDRRSRGTLDQMSADIRQAQQLKSCSSSNQPVKMVFQTDNGDLTFTYNTTNKTVTRTFLGKDTTLITECQVWNPKFFQRTTISNTWDQYALDDPVGQPSLCKLVQLNWTCSRKILGKEMDTESVQSVKVVMRKP